MDTTNNPDLFLVNLWAEKIYRLHPYPVFYLHWPASKLFDGIFLSNITSLDVIKIIHSSARATRKDKPGFTEDDMGTQSNRLSAAMDMYLSKCTSFHNNTNWPLILWCIPCLHPSENHFFHTRNQLTNACHRYLVNGSKLLHTKIHTCFT